MSTGAGRVADAQRHIFFVKDGVLHTRRPLLPRRHQAATVIGLAKKRGIQVIDRTIMPDELATFSECFLAGTAARFSRSPRSAPTPTSRQISEAADLTL